MQIFTLEHHELLCNVVTRFSQLYCFLTVTEHFPDSSLKAYYWFFFIRKIKHFSINCRDRFLKYVPIVQIYENLWKSPKQFSRFLVWNGHYSSTKMNSRKLFLQFLDKRFFLILKQSSTFSMLSGIGKMFRARSPVFRSKLSITH